MLAPFVTRSMIHTADVTADISLRGFDHTDALGIEHISKNVNSYYSLGYIIISMRDKFVTVRN